MSGNILLAPVLVPFAFALIGLLAPRTPRVQATLSVLGAVGLLISSLAVLWAVLAEGVIAISLGNWQAPVGIAFAADALAAAMVLVTALIGLAGVIYAIADVPESHVRGGFHPLMQGLLGGVCGAFLTADLFNLYVWFEVMLITSFGLLTLGGTRAQFEGGLKYVALNLVSTIAFLAAIGLLYGLTGTLNMADLHLTVPEVENQGAVSAIAVLFIVAFGIKAGLFPLFFWLPASYHTPSFVVSAVFAGLLTKVGVYALVRCFTLIFTGDVGLTHTLLLWIAAFTMVTGVLGAAAQNEWRRILSFHIISQIGYMILGLALFTERALAGTVFYIVHHILVKANLFFVAGLAARSTGSEHLKAVGGLYQKRPWMALLFLIPAFSLAGFPPLSGFWAKYVLVRAGLEAEAFIVTGIALLVGLLTIYSMVKIWSEAFWKAHPQGDDAVRPVATSPAHRAALYGPVAGLALLTVMIGATVAPLYDLAAESGRQLLTPVAYVTAVLGPEAVASHGAGAGGQAR